jgi:hypothetical protein
MKSFTLSVLISGFFLMISFTCVYGQDTTKTDKKKETVEYKQHFIDEDGDGYNDNVPDHDGDGIPNSLDTDWQKLNEEKRNRQRFVDLDGDGINDNLQMNVDSERGENQNLHQEKKGSSLDNKSKEEQQKQQKKQRGKP